MRYAAIVTSAGSSTRFSSDILSSQPSGLQSSGLQTKKEFVRPACLGGKTVLESACSAFVETQGLECLVITYKDGTLEQTKEAVKNILGRFANVMFVKGGHTRQESVYFALEALGKLDGSGFDLVAIHDGSRPFVTSKLVSRCLEAASKTGGSAPVLHETDTIVEVVDGRFARRLERDRTFRIQTPQVFRFNEILEAHRKAEKKAKEGRLYTDDTQVYMDFGLAVEAVEGEPENRKITYAGDLA